MFCGLPMGVHMEPRLAATVSATTVAMVARGLTPRKSARASGTNVMSATSLVTSIELANTTFMSTNARLRAEPTRPMSQSRTRSRSPARPNPATTVMRQNSRPMVRMSM